MWGPWAADAVAAGAVISCFGALNGWILLEGRLPLAAAADGLLPPVLARMSGRGTPAVALAMSSALVTLVVATNYTKGLVPAFTFIILLSTLTTLIPCALSCLALLRLRRGHGNALPGGLGAAAPVIAGLAFLYSAWAIVGTGPETIVWAVVLLATGIPPYVWLARRGRRGSGPAAPTP
jgi:APA family basic amino acid/polyamine antiporter